MDFLVSFLVATMVLVIGLTFVLYPRWGLKLVCRCARSYMNDNLASDPVYVLAFRFYGVAAAGLGFYALLQVFQVL